MLLALWVQDPLELREPLDLRALLADWVHLERWGGLVILVPLELRDLLGLQA